MWGGETVYIEQATDVVVRHADTKDMCVACCSGGGAYRHGIECLCIIQGVNCLVVQSVVSSASVGEKRRYAEKTNKSGRGRRVVAAKENGVVPYHEIIHAQIAVEFDIPYRLVWSSMTEQAEIVPLGILHITNAVVVVVHPDDGFIHFAIIQHGANFLYLTVQASHQQRQKNEN